MEALLLLLLIFSVWQSIEHRKSRPKKESNWKEVAECEVELAEQSPSSPIVLPTMEERIASCYETLAQCQEQWAWHQAHERLNHHPEDDAELVGLLYSPDRLHRANIFKDGQRYIVQYENLYLIEEDALRLIYRPGMFCGDWLYDGGESWFDSLEEAQEAAGTVLDRMG